jgi:hypothetical protein
MVNETPATEPENVAFLVALANTRESIDCASPSVLNRKAFWLHVVIRRVAATKANVSTTTVGDVLELQTPTATIKFDYAAVFICYITSACHRSING